MTSEEPLVIQPSRLSTAFHKDSKVKADACTDEPVIVALFKGTAVEVIA
jgi:hypothetical protein